MKRSQIKRRPLTDTVFASLEPEERDYRELDGNSLYFRVKKNGAKSWNLRYKKTDGKWSWLGLGGFPAVSGKAARQKVQELQQLASDGIDLSSYRQEQSASAKQVYTFAQSAETWFERKQQSGLAKGTLRQMRLYLDRDILPALGNKDITAITRGDCAGVQAAIESRNAHVIAGKVRRWVSQIFSEAIARGRCELNPASELRHIAESGPRTQNYPHLLEHKLPDFLKEFRNGTARMRFLTTTLAGYEAGSGEPGRLDDIYSGSIHTGHANYSAQPNVSSHGWFLRRPATRAADGPSKRYQGGTAD